MLKTQGLQSLEQICAFLEGTLPLSFEAPARKDAYHWIAKELRRFNCLRLGKADKSLVPLPGEGQRSLASMSTGLILGLAIGSTLARTGIGW